MFSTVDFRADKYDKMTIKFFLLPLSVFFLLTPLTFSRIHHLTIHNDNRKYIPLSSFGFYTGGRYLLEKITMNKQHFNFKACSTSKCLDSISTPTPT